MVRLLQSCYKPGTNTATQTYPDRNKQRGCNETDHRDRIANLKDTSNTHKKKSQLRSQEQSKPNYSLDGSRGGSSVRIGLEIDRDTSDVVSTRSLRSVSTTGGGAAQSVNTADETVVRRGDGARVVMKKAKGQQERPLSLVLPSLSPDLFEGSMGEQFRSGHGSVHGSVHESCSPRSAVTEDELPRGNGSGCHCACM